MHASDYNSIFTLLRITHEQTFHDLPNLMNLYSLSIYLLYTIYNNIATATFCKTERTIKTQEPSFCTPLKALFLSVFNVKSKSEVGRIKVVEVKTLK